MGYDTEKQWSAWLLIERLLCPLSLYCSSHVVLGLHFDFPSFHPLKLDNRVLDLAICDSVPMINLFKCGITFAHVFVHLVNFVSGIPNLLFSIDLDASKEGFGTVVGSWVLFQNQLGAVKCGMICHITPSNQTAVLSHCHMSVSLHFVSFHKSHDRWWSCVVV